MNKSKLSILVCFAVITVIISLSFSIVMGAKSKTIKNVSKLKNTAKFSRAETSSGSHIGAADLANAKSNGNKLKKVLRYNSKVTPTARQAAADRAAAAGPTFATAKASAMPMPGAAPHYFSHPNYANSPLRMPDALITLVGNGTGATAAATVDPTTGAITAITVVTPGSGYTTAPNVVISTAVVTPSLAANATAVLSGGGGVASITVNNGGSGYVTPGIRKFVDSLPGLGPGGVNNLGQYIPIAVPDTTTYPDTDFYTIAVIQYREKMHSDLPATLLRGYVQLSTSVVPGARVALTNAKLDGTTTPITGYAGVDRPHYLGPQINATKNRPVRIKFINLLPTGVAGKLFIPVDTTVMGSGMGPNMGGMAEMDPQNPMCGAVIKPANCYTENRATLHLHGGITPWISDGTAHQWITPANESTPYPQGVSVVAVPDMVIDDTGNSSDGIMTFYYTNQQSARLLFYHDHSYGITRLNVYAGESAGYLITDDTEKALIAAGIIPATANQMLLVIQDKTFVPADWQLAMQDETWDMASWGGLGNLWVPHVYSPAQNAGDSSGVNQFGRWAYGPWFWPPTTAINYGPIANPYYDPACDPDLQWCEPPLMPGTPYLSMGMETFNDTPMINGTAYPTATVDPKTYRFRILNAANDRFFNLSWYVADASGTEVALNAAEVAAALTDPTIFPTPDEALSPKGPNWIQIATEGGFLPSPVVIPSQPITWVTDPTVFNAGNVDKHALVLGSAERVDVIVDFSAYAGKTLILYNDAPAAFPARDPRYDYYTGNADLTTTGGAPSTMPGYGPNTRTVMQVKVNAGGGQPAFNLTALQTAFKATSLGGSGVFQTGQHPIIVGQGAYNNAYGTTFQNNGPNDGLARISSTSLSFKTLANGALGASLTFPLQPKMLQDEMGEAFDKAYGRMSGYLGVETPNASAGNQNMILYPYGFPPSEVLAGLVLPAGVAVTPIVSADDGTQLWKITHNGVDTHPIHWHLYDVQIINRVGWDGVIRKPDLNELGWKDTLRVSPLEDTIVALRPIIPQVPFDLPNSVRLIDPTMPEGAMLTSANVLAFAPDGTPIDIVNHLVNFGWEYMWHCHILSHEEMDMMRSQAVAIAPRAPTSLIAEALPYPQGARLTWTDNSANETGFTIQRATDAAFTTELTTFSVGQNTAVFNDTTVLPNTTYYYRVKAINLVGDTQIYATGATFPTKQADSAFSNTATVPTAAVGGTGGGGCFIATAAYGSSLEPHVVILRQFRDRFLLSNTIGKAFVKLYYTYSPPAADFIAKHETLKAMVRWILLPVIWVSQLFIIFGINGSMIILALMFTLIYFTSLQFIKRTRFRRH
jgi:FtsP/CotA-like multicopper oxidase with cupredoxin domain